MNVLNNSDSNAEVQDDSQLSQHFEHNLTFAFFFSTGFLLFLIVIYAYVGVKLILDKRYASRRNSRASSFASNASVQERLSCVKRYSSVDHKFVMETLKKKPSKSILITPERCSKQLQFDNNRQSLNNSIYRGSQLSNLSAGNVYDQVDKASNLSDEIYDANRRSAVSIKSVTFNERTQVRKIKKVARF